jgi:hypothetical protein
VLTGYIRAAAFIYNITSAIEDVYVEQMADGLNEKEKGLVVLGQGCLQSAHLTLPTLNDHKQTTYNDYRIRAIPTVILVHRDGVVIKHLRGSRPAEELREELKAAGL